MSDEKINLEQLKKELWSWYYEEFGRGEMDTLTQEQALILYDCMVVVSHLQKQMDDVVVKDASQRKALKKL